jgi:hypothetical protein
MRAIKVSFENLDALRKNRTVTMVVKEKRTLIYKGKFSNFVFLD